MSINHSVSFERQCPIMSISFVWPFGNSYLSVSTPCENHGLPMSKSISFSSSLIHVIAKISIKLMFWLFTKADISVKQNSDVQSSHAALLRRRVFMRESEVSQEIEMLQHWFGQRGRKRLFKNMTDKHFFLKAISTKKLRYNFFLNHIGPESRLFATKCSSAETGMGVTSRP